MFAVEPLNENKINFDSNLTNKMGQITSSNSQAYNSPNGKINKSIYQRYSTIQSTPEKVTKTEPAYGPERIHKVKDTRIMRNPILRNSSMRTPSDRPTTISEINAYNTDKKDALKNPAVDLSKTKEFHRSGESYHKTEICYYKTPDGGFQKLPDDSYHKRTDNCYIKLETGQFQKLNEISNSTNLNNDSLTKSMRVKNNVMKFLKRSKSHTPATIREMQKEKERDRTSNMTTNKPLQQHLQLQNQQLSVTNQQQPPHQPNRRVMVTMIDGGLPVVATSKVHATKPSKEREKELQKNRNNTSKVNI
jgi:MAP/microtubule affinity-regulating kinase